MEKTITIERGDDFIKVHQKKDGNTITATFQCEKFEKYSKMSDEQIKKEFYVEK